MADELKPCPFCGGTASTQRFGNSSGGAAHAVWCGSCHMSTPWMHGDDGEGRATEAWNRRAAPPSLVADDGLPPLPEPCKAVLPLGWIRYTADQLRQAQRDAMAPLERKLRAFQAIFNAAPDEWAGLGAAPQPPKENS